MGAPCHVVIAIDGPSGVGKSTVARRLAQRLGFRYVDSGALYRAVGWLVRRHGVSLTDAAAIAALLAQHPLGLAFQGERLVVCLDGHDVSRELRGEEVGAAASAVATVAAVRQAITARLRQLRCEADLVVEGRDIGTVVFPDAAVKFFLTATPAVRGQRRWQELQQAGQEVSLAAVLEAMARRDAQDKQRALAPLAPAAEARIIDTSDLTVDEVVDTMLSEIQTKIQRPQRA